MERAAAAAARPAALLGGSGLCPNDDDGDWGFQEKRPRARVMNVIQETQYLIHQIYREGFQNGIYLYWFLPAQKRKKWRMLILDCNLRERRKFKSSSLSFHNGLQCVECTYKRCYLRITLLVIFNIIQYILAHGAWYRQSSDNFILWVFSITIAYYRDWDIKPILRFQDIPFLLSHCGPSRVCIAYVLDVLQLLYKRKRA